MHSSFGTRFVDSQYEFRCSFGCVLLSNQIIYHSVPFDNTTPIYLINLPWKLGLGLGLDLSSTILAFFTENKENEHPISSANFTEGNIVKKNVTTCYSQQHNNYMK